MRGVVVFWVSIFLLIGLSFFKYQEANGYPEQEVEEMHSISRFIRSCLPPNPTGINTMQRYSQCVNCSCRALATFDCVLWYFKNGNTSQVETNNSCSFCNPFWFAGEFTCMCFDDHAKVYRQPLELWKPATHLSCTCDPRGISCNETRNFADNFITFLNSHSSMWNPPINQSDVITIRPSSVLDVIKKPELSSNDCNVDGLRIEHGTVQNVILGGYPRCLKCACYNGNPYCVGDWKYQRRYCSSVSNCTELFQFASKMCKNPDNLVCEKETYSWNLNGCNYSCTEEKLDFQMIKRPWCQRLSNSKYCAWCGNKTAFLAKYSTKLTLCSKIEDIISTENVCDGYPDCQDKTDEENCTKIYCSSTTTNVGNRMITWQRVISNSSYQVKCSQIDALWQGNFVKTCYHEPGGRAEFLKGSYCSCTDARLFNSNASDFCAAYLIINQYMLLSFYSWIFLEVFHLFLMLVCVLRARMLKKYYVTFAGWGLPLCVVALEAGVFFQSLKENKSCVAYEKNDWLIKGPIGFLLSMSCIFFLAIVVVLVRRSYRSDKHVTDASRSRTMTGKAFLVLVPIMGITFIFEYELENRIIMYIEVVIKSSMGILLAIFNFYLNETVQSAFKEYKRKKKFKRSSISNVNAENLSKNGVGSSMQSNQGNLEA